jgi:2',3'-cyclic-nucleotide 2'-phosphodiesterase (5'-nucleotidase family)
MKKALCLSFFSLVLLAGETGCRSHYQPASAQYKDYHITGTSSRDAAVDMLMKPYSDSVNLSMNDVIGRTSVALEKKQPEGTLGNFMADAMLEIASHIYNRPVDAAFVNNGGVRLPQIPAGPITRGKIFELMPFDNLLVIQEVRGADLQSFLNLAASKGGWPVSGITMQIDKDHKAVNIKVHGRSLDPSAKYVIANSDYMANGGDDAFMLKSIPQVNRGYLLRDAFFDYIAFLAKNGKEISGNIENRVTDVE